MAAVPRQRKAGAPAMVRGPVRGRVAAVTPDDGGIRGLLHDLGHGLATLALLVEAAEGAGERDRVLPLLEAETSRLLAMVHTGLRRAAPEPVAVRPLLEQVAGVANGARDTAVSVEPGPEITLDADPTLVWRAVSNVVDNAVRAAGPSGRVRLSAVPAGRAGVVVEVVDDGPGFPRGSLRPGHLGLKVVTGLLDACGGALEIRDAQPRGASVRLVFGDPVVAGSPS